MPDKSRPFVLDDDTRLKLEIIDRALLVFGKKTTGELWQEFGLPLPRTYKISIPQFKTLLAQGYTVDEALAIRGRDSTGKRIK